MCPTNISCTSCKILLSSYKEDIFFSFFFFIIFFSSSWRKLITDLEALFEENNGTKQCLFCETCQSTKDAWDVFFLCCFCQQEVLLLGTTITCTVLALRNLCLVLRAGSRSLPLPAGRGRALSHLGGSAQPWIPEFSLSIQTDAQ